MESPVPLLSSLGAVRFSGVIAAPKDLSGVTDAPGGIYIASDEPDRRQNVVQWLREVEPGHFAVEGEQIVVPGEGELDLEGLAAGDNEVYALGSHALVRNAIETWAPEKKHCGTTYDEQRRRLLKLSRSKRRVRSVVWRFRRMGADRTWQGTSISLLPVVKHDPLLKPFSRIPSKENGIDLEGIALRGEELLIGFRGPVLRDGWAMVLCTTFRKPAAYELRFLPLGAGIRDLACEQDWLLVLSGPTTDGPGRYALWAWDGRDCLPGVGAPGGKLLLLGLLPDHGKAEGIAVIRRSPDRIGVLVLFDGLHGGGPQHFEVAWPPQGSFVGGWADSVSCS